MSPLKIEPIVKLWTHQINGVLAATMPEPRSYAFFFDVGTGKSATMVNVLRHIFLHHGGIMNTLILAPVAVLKNWEKEIATHSTGVQHVEILSGPVTKRVKKILAAKIMGKKKIFVTNYDALTNKALPKALLEWGPQVLVCDESQRVKNPAAVRTKAVTTLADVCRYKYLLSGTPITNSPMDIYSQFRILDGGETFGKNFFTFRNTWFYDANAGMPTQKHFPDWRPRPGVYAAFNKMIYEKAMRAIKSECLDLPPFIRTTRHVELSAEQKALYTRMKQDWVAYIDDKAFVAQIALTKALRMQQIISGFCTDDEGGCHVIKTNPRLAALAEMLEDMHTQHKIIVWACFKENYRTISQVCEKLKIPYRMLIGGMSDVERNAAMTEFESDSKIRVMIANQGAGGVGINLISSDVSIYFSKTYSLEQDLQSEARNYRGGTEKLHTKVTRIDLVAPDTIDEVVNEALAKKLNASEAILKWRGR
jgi:SNF2 family DNA or RNA helicase